MINKNNLDKLITEALVIEAEEAKKAGKLGYMARALVQATLPHSKVNGSEFKRTNGAFRLTILADSEIGLPYGNIPRLLIAWISTEAVKTKKRELILGNTLSEFMRQLGLVPTGGRRGTITRFKDQVKRLLASSISCTYDDGTNWAIKNVRPVTNANLWWELKNPNQASIFESTLVLSEEFFNEIISNPIPIDMRALKTIKRSPMAIDIYCWLTYRVSYLKKTSYIPWKGLQVQFGADYDRNRDFKKYFLSQLKIVTTVYQEIKFDINDANLILKPSKPHIPLSITTL